MFMASEERRLTFSNPKRFASAGLTLAVPDDFPAE